MKKRFISLVAVLCLCLTMLPTPARAISLNDTLSWLRAQVGRSSCDLDKNGVWCTDLATAYINYCWLRENGDGRDPWGLYPYTTKNANQYDEYLSGNPNWTIIPRTSSTVPQPGDIFVSEQDYYGYGAGHVGIVLTPHGTTGAEIIEMSQDVPPRIRTVTWGGPSYGAEKFIRFNFFSGSSSSTPSEPTISFGPWEQAGYTYIGETDASIGQAIRISTGANPSDSGMYLYDANGNHIATGKNGQLSTWWDYVYFKINEECKYTLSPGTTYKYKFYVVVNGKTYWGPEGSFKTNGTTGVTGVTLSERSLSLPVGTSASLTYSVTPSSAADQTIRVSSSNRSVAIVSVNGNTIQVDAKASGTSTITVTTTDGGYTATCNVTVTDNAFTDVIKNAWYYPAIKFVTERGIMSGYSSGLFGPDDNLSRAMVVQTLYNAAGKPSVSAANPFSDIPAGQWFTDAVRWSASKKIVSGFGNGLFKPNDSLTVEQLAVILYNYAGAPAVSGSPSGLGQYSSWASNALRWAQKQNILSGVPFSNASDPSTRAQTAQMLMNFLK